MLPDREIEDGDKLFLRAGLKDSGRPDRFLSYVIHPGAAQARLTVFFAHGGGGNKHQWRHQWRHLAGRGHRLVAWDALGHGESVQPRHWKSYAGDALLADFLEVLERFGSRSNLIVAHSLGARMTLAVLQQLEARGELARVGVAVLLGVAPLSLRIPGVLALPSFVLELLRKPISARFNRLAWHPDADAALVQHERSVTRRNRLFTMQALLHQAPVIDKAALARLTVPVELVGGDSDGVTPVEHARELQSLLPDARLHVIERCGHQLMLERPDRVNEIIDAAVLRCGAT